MKLHLTIILLSVMLNFSSCGSTATEYEIFMAGQYKEEIQLETLTYDGGKMNKNIFSSPKIFIVGILMDAEEENQQLMPSEARIIHLNKRLNFKNDKDPLADTLNKLKDVKDIHLPIFELEFEREPLDYLIDSMKEHYKLDCWPVNTVGLTNQYGLTINPNANKGQHNYGSSVEDYFNADHGDLLNTVQKGPLIGTIMGIKNSYPRFNAYEAKISEEENNFWKKQKDDRNFTSEPAIYIGYTIAAKNIISTFKMYKEENPNLELINYTVGMDTANIDWATPLTKIEETNINFVFQDMIAALENVEKKNYSEWKGQSLDSLDKKLPKITRRRNRRRNRRRTRRRTRRNRR